MEIIELCEELKKENIALKKDVDFWINAHTKKEIECANLSDEIADIKQTNANLKQEIENFEGALSPSGPYLQRRT